MHINNSDRNSLFRDALPILPIEEERAYLHLAKFSKSPSVKKKARDKVIRSHYRFLGGMAIRWGNTFGIEPEELMAEGAYYMQRAVDNFDMEAKNIKFLSFASWYIRCAFQEVIKKTRPMLKMPDDEIRKMVRLDMQAAGDDDSSSSTLGELIPDETMIEIQESKENREEAFSKIMELTRGMESSARHMLFTYYGLGSDDSNRNTRELAESLGVSPQYVSRTIDTAKRFMLRRARGQKKDS
jgi:RNA polymerase sigma factor (sigma-70 family)